MSRKRLTSIDLAKIAGVSSATVSRAFTPGTRISSATRSRILLLADEHNYRPNAVARLLNSSRSRLVALVVNAIANPCEAQQLDMLVHRLQRIERMPLVLCCADYGDRTQLMHFASAYQVEHVVLCSDMVSASDAVDIFKVGRANDHFIRAGGRPAPFAPCSDRRRGGGKRGRRAPGQWRQASLRLPFWPRLKAGSTSSVVLGSPRRLHATSSSYDAEAHGDYSYEFAYKEAVMLVATRFDRCRCLLQRRNGDRRSGCRGVTSGDAASPMTW